MSEQSATEVLRYEHRLILQVAASLAEAIAAADSGEVPDLDLVSDCISFFRLYADACHHAKEEELLFTELEQTGMPRDEGPIAVMLEEHRVARSLVRGMSEAIRDARDDETALVLLRRRALAYVDLIRAHIAREDGVLFEIADQAIRGPQCRRLCDAYEQADACEFESRTKPGLEDLAERIAARSGG